MREYNVGQGGPTGGIGPDLAPDGKSGGGKLLTRRDFLKLSAAAAGGAVLAACGPLFRQKPTRDLPPPGVSTQKVEETSSPAPPEIPTNFAGILINTEYLIKNGSILAKPISPDVLPQPTPIPVPEATAQNIEALNTLPTEYTAKTFELGEFDPANPIHVLDYAIAQGARQGTDGGVTYYQEGINGEESAFSKLSMYREKIQNPQDIEYVIQEGYPAGLVLRDGSGITVVGTAPDGNIVIAFEEYIDRGKKDFFQPRIRYASVPPTELGRISKAFLPTMKYFTDKPDQITYIDSTTQQERTVQLNTIDQSVMVELEKEIKGNWVDKYEDPKSETGFTLFLDPFVRYPDPEKDEIPEGIDIANLTYTVVDLPQYKGKTRSKKMLAKDADGNLELVGRYSNSEKKWIWNRPDLRYLRDGNLFTTNWGVTVDNAEDWLDPNYVESAGELFSVLYPSGAFFISHTDTFGWEAADVYRKRATLYDQILYINPVFWHKDTPESLNVATDEVIIEYQKNRIRKILRYVNKVDDGNQPTYITFLGEALFYDEFGRFSGIVGRHGYEPSPYQRAHCRIKEKYQDQPSDNHVMSKTLVMFAQIAKEMGIEWGKDFRLVYGDYNIYKPGGKLDFVIKELSRAMQEASVELGVPEEFIPVDIGMQCNIFLTNKPDYISGAPTDEQLSQAIRILKKKFGRVHLSEVNIIGAKDQAELTGTLEWINRVATTEGVDALNYYYPLRERAIDANEAVYYARQGLFGSDHKPTEEYYKLVQDLLPDV